MSTRSLGCRTTTKGLHASSQCTHKRKPALVLGVLMLGLFASTGCVTFTNHAVPASRLPHQFEAPSRCNLYPINFQLLAKPQISEYYLDSGDVLGITIVGIMPVDPKETPPIVQPRAAMQAREYYPALGMVDTPSAGIPFKVQSDGTLGLPQIDPIQVRGLTIHAAATKIAQTYIKADLLKEDRDEVHVQLVRGRVNRIVVLREDASLESAAVVRKGEAIMHKRGSAIVVDLPEGESDVLHALAASGGLPGVDAYNEIWILRRSSMSDTELSTVDTAIAGGSNPSQVIRQVGQQINATRIPLKLCPDEPLEFDTNDVALQPGDIVYIEPRHDDHFYTGGLLPGGQIPLPRDEDLDVIEAIALAQGSVGGLGGTSSMAVLRAGAGPGNIVPPTRVLVLRKLPNGQQLAIRVDLNLAMKDSKERIKIMAGDYIMMYYKPHEMAANAALNLFNFNWLLN